MEQVKLNQRNYRKRIANRKKFGPSTSTDNVVCNTIQKHDSNNLRSTVRESVFNESNVQNSNAGSNVMLQNSNTNANSVITVIDHDHCYSSQNIENVIDHDHCNSSKNIENAIDYDHCYFSQNIQNDNNNERRAFIHPVDIIVPEIIKSFLGEMNIECVHCKAKHFSGERVSRKGNSFHDCCSHGNVKLLSDPEFPMN